jgi:hypothetical protein
MRDQKLKKINKNSAKVKIYNATLLSMSPVGSTTNGRVLIKKVLSTWIAKISCHGQRQILHHLNPVPTRGGGGGGGGGKKGKLFGNVGQEGTFVRGNQVEILITFYYIF